MHAQPPHSLRRDNFKGMTSQQEAAIWAEKARQVAALKHRREAQKAEDKRYDEYLAKVHDAAAQAEADVEAHRLANRLKHREELVAQAAEHKRM